MADTERAQQMFVAVGFEQVRQAVLAPTVAVTQTSTETFNALVEYVEGIVRQLELDPKTDPAELEQARDEVEVFKATRAFKARLVELSKRRDARQRIAVPGLVNGRTVPR